MRLFRNKLPETILIVAFVLAFLFLLAKWARAESTIQVEAGAAVIHGYTPALGLSIQWPLAGPARTDYELGFMLIGDGNYNGDDFGNQVVWYGMLWDGYRAIEMGIGAAYFNVDSPFTCDFTFALGARWRVAERVAAQWRHYSTAGSCQPNTGRDLLTVAWRF